MAMNQMYLAACKPVEILSRQGGVSARVECKCCGGHEDWGLTKFPPPDIIHKHFKTKGWEIAKRPTCPICQNAKKRKPEMTKPATVTPISGAVSPPSVAAPSTDAKAARREAHDLIAVYFDIPNGSYTDGYSDQRVAEETGVAVAWVKQRREEEFGPIKTPREFAELQDQIAAAMARQREIKSTLDEIEARMNELAKRSGWQ